MSSGPFGKRKAPKQPSVPRRSSFNLLNALHDDTRASGDGVRESLSASSSSSKLLKKKKKPPSPDSLQSDSAGGPSPPDDGASPRASGTAVRPGHLRKGRPSSIFGSLKSFRTADDETTPPATASSSKPPSLNWAYFGSSSADDVARNKTVLHHGEAQTNSTLFWKKKEYLVLTETHLVRFKSQAKAAETFASVLPSTGHGSRAAGLVRHASSPSAGSNPESHSLASEASGDKIAAVPLRHVVAVFQPDDAAKSQSTVELSYLDPDVGQGANLHFTFADSQDRALWQRALRQAANCARLQDLDPIPPRLNELAARVVEREQDYDVTNYRIYKVVRRSTKSSVMRSSDDVAKLASTVCFLVVGVRKVHLVVLSKHLARTSTSSLAELNDGGSFGVMALTAVHVAAADDTFSLTFRLPLQPPRVLQLASLASFEIAVRIRQVEHMLRPGWHERPYIFDVPAKVEELADDDDDEQLAASHAGEDRFDRTLIAYCVAYGVNPALVRYSVNTVAQDAPRFELGESAHGHGRPYSALELLALLRSLRYHDAFASMSFARIDLGCLNGLHDRHGAEHVCISSTQNRHVRLDAHEQAAASLLVQEVRALAICNARLRQLDFSGCMPKRPHHAADGGVSAQRQAIGCGFLEALFPLCKQQATNVDWIALNGIELQEIDLDYFVSIAAERGTHFRAIEASACGLDDRGVALLLDVFRAHDSTLEALDISSNAIRLVPNILSHQLQVFGYIRKLDLSNLAVSSSTDALLPPELLLSWHLEDLRLRGLALNAQSVDAICAYLASPQSLSLKELILSNASLTGEDVAALMQSMTQDPGTARLLHLDVSENELQRRFRPLVDAIAAGLAPTHLSMRATEYDGDEPFEALLAGLAANKSIRYLDLGKTSLPAEADDDTCAALHRLLADNQTLEELDISGEDSRLEVSKLGAGLNHALHGLKANRSLRILRIQHQRLGLHGASTLAEVLKENRCLQQLHCDCNAITLTGFTDLVNALATNTTILYLPSLEEGRVQALQDTERQIKAARTRAEGWASASAPSSKLSSMRRTFASISGGGGGASSATSKSAAGPPRLASVPQWTEQDVQAALRLVSEGWEGQAQRLEQFLDRNWRMQHGEVVPPPLTALDPNEAHHQQRPGTAGSLSKVLDRVALESTPTLEKQLRLGHDTGPLPSRASAGSSTDYTATPGREAAFDAASFYEDAASELQRTHTVDDDDDKDALVMKVSQRLAHAGGKENEQLKPGFIDRIVASRDSSSLEA